MSPSEWKWLGTMDPTMLVDARLQLHWAAQIVASVGYTFIKPEPDYGHLSLQWLPEQHVLASRSTSTQLGFRAALQPNTLTLLLLDSTNKPVTSYSLGGHTLDEGYRWLADALMTFAKTTKPLIRPDHELPHHPVADGTKFLAEPPEVFVELNHWFNNAHSLLSLIIQGKNYASPVRCWPHHFDITTLLQYDREADPEEARSIGIGLSPGDGSYAEPYWYILPWPPPKNTDFPSLNGGGMWHTNGWIGAVLPATQLVKVIDATSQFSQVRAFVQSGIDAGRILLSLSD